MYMEMERLSPRLHIKPAFILSLVLELSVKELSTSLIALLSYRMKMLCYIHLFTNRSFSCHREIVAMWASIDTVYTVCFEANK